MTRRRNYPGAPALHGYWTRRAQAAIAATLARLADTATTADKRRALRAAYPFGERSNWPYKVWCREVRAALRVPPTHRRTVDDKTKRLFELE